MYIFVNTRIKFRHLKAHKKTAGTGIGYRNEALARMKV